MPLRTMCRNRRCPKHTVYTGGEFIYSSERKAFFCKECFRVPAIMNGAKNLWEFDTTHFNGEKIHVRNAAHLQQLEKQYGVSNHAFHNDEAHWDIPPSSRPEPMNPELKHMLGRAKEMGQMDRGSQVSGEWQR